MYAHDTYVVCGWEDVTVGNSRHLDFLLNMSAADDARCVGSNGTVMRKVVPT